ncbi:heterokaryon incompatibility protein-domain-containing protein [Xylaria intraflava]|nr:heterokaryon incompatibility protein-domain-containing protein [Xylaria intraflava]
MSTIYGALNEERREIRLLNLHPSASFDGTIQCSLFNVFLGSPPEYEALSYVWGPLEFTQDILVEGQPFQITENLECALRHLRHASSARVIWVDALCINQANIAERNHQVTLMKDIYSQCTRDLAWLGPNPGSFRLATREKQALESSRTESDREEQHEEVVDFGFKRIQEGMRIFRNMHRRDKITLDTMLSRWQHRRDLLMNPQDDGGEAYHCWLLSYDEEDSLLQLFRYASLWSRAWVMQEISCAQRVLLLAGTETVDWSDINSFLGDENRPYADAFHVTGGHHSVYGILVSIFGLIQTIQQQRRIMKDVEEGKYESRLIDVLARFKYADARDPRDLIYGFLGLVSQKHTIRVDYAKPMEALSIEVTSFFINESANLDIICQNPWTVNGNAPRDRVSSPSWAVDFADERRSGHFEGGLEAMLFGQRGIFSAGPPSCSVPCKVSPGGLLHVSGVILDEVRVIVEEHEAEDEEWYHMWINRFFDGEKLIRDNSATYVPTGEPHFRAYWRTLVMDCMSYPIRRLLPEDIEADDKVFTKMAQLDFARDHATATDDFVSSFRKLRSSMMLNRSFVNWAFAMSKTGLLLMVGKNAQVGDVLAILDGGKVPCLLRPCRDGRELRYRVLNSTYIHGYMEGRAATDVQQGLLQKQEILLA